MAEYSNQIDLQIESLKENLYTIELCLNFDKQESPNWTGNSKVGCLGVPATILLCSLIDTIGSVFRNSEMEFPIDGANYKIEKAAEHFYILNHVKFFNLNLSMSTIQDFYSTYRSKLTHNTALPANNYLSIGDISDKIFELDSNQQITKINLRSLSVEVEKAVETLIYYLKNGTFSSTHKLTDELNNSVKLYDASMQISTSDTGHTHTIL